MDSIVSEAKKRGIKPIVVEIVPFNCQSYKHVHAVGERIRKMALDYYKGEAYRFIGSKLAGYYARAYENMTDVQVAMSDQREYEIWREEQSEMLGNEGKHLDSRLMFC